MPKRSKPAASTEANVGSVATRLLRYVRGGKSGWRPDWLAAEEPLELRIRGRSIAITMRTPGHDRELAAGFLLTEGIIRNRSDIVEIAPCRQSESPGNTWNVFLAAGIEVDFERLTRHVFASSSCGVCGKASIDAVRQQFPAIKSQMRLRAATIMALPRLMLSAQGAFAQTGGLHAAALFDRQGKMIVLREDVGRHNAVDKALGYFLLQERALGESILLVSGRASFEIVQKALAAGVPIICAVSAPSSLAVEFARESGQTLVGFLRGGTMNIYSYAERIIGARNGRKAARD